MKNNKLRKFLMVFMLLLVAACGYEGQQECEKIYSNQKDAAERCRCMYEAAKRNKVDNFKEFLLIVTNEEKQKDLMDMMMISSFGGDIGQQNKIYIQTIQDIALSCMNKKK